MRQHTSAYMVFYSQFVRTIVGKRLFKQRIGTMSEDEEIATVSDEALALLGIENSAARWNDVFERSQGKIRQIRKDEPYPEEWKSSVMSLYTGTTKSDPSLDGDTEDRRWSQAGIERFNELRKMILQDRQKYPSFKSSWLREQRLKLHGKATVATSNATDDNNIVDADDDLFGSNVALAGSPTARLVPARQVTGVADEDDASSVGSNNDVEVVGAQVEL